MRLALITQDFTPKVGGIQTYALELAKRLHHRCDFFCVIAPDMPGAAEVDQELPFPVKRIKTTEPLLGWMSIPTLPAYFHQRKIDTVFHAQWNTLPVSMLMKKRGLVQRVFVAAHGRELLFNPYENTLIGNWFEKLRQKMLSQVDHFFPVSEFTAELLQKEDISSDKIKVVSNGTDPTEFYPLQNDSLKRELQIEEKKVLLTITRLVSRKGIDMVLRVLPKIIKNHPDAYYLIVGEGEYRPELENLVAELKLEEYVHFTGRVAYPELIRYYNTCDVFVMPSKTEFPDVEGFGLVFLEANACAKPVIGSNSGGIPSAIIHGQTGLLVEEQNPDELSAAVNRLLENPEWAKELGEKGRKRVHEEANWDKAVDEILKIVNI